MIYYCTHCREPIISGDRAIRPEPPFHGFIHEECYPLWAEDYYGETTDAVGDYELRRGE
jgi:hypothetical protein